MHYTRYLYFLLLLIISPSCIQSDKTISKIYHDIEADKFCFRRLNATHQVGCSSYRGGAVGVIHLVEKEGDIDWIVKKGPNSPYIATLTLPFFTTKHMQTLKASNRVSGIIILQTNDLIPSRFSPDSSCPNENFGLYTDQDKELSHCKKGSWNLNNPALNMMYEDWNMPIFLVTNDSDIQAIEKCFGKSNSTENVEKSWPLCSAQLQSQMSAAKDTPTCMRRNKINNLKAINFCDPLSDQNIILPLFPTNKSESYSNRSLLVVGTRIDTFSMFDQISPGAHSVVPSLITLISVAKTLANFKEELQREGTFENIVFMIFNGEAFDYIGSSRVVFDMEKGTFPRSLDPSVETQPSPIRLEHISHFVELSQMVPNDTVWIHTDPITTERNQKSIDEMIQYLHQASGSPNFQISNTSRPLPPASVQQFLKKDENIASLVLADHEADFTNKYYNSLFDNKETLPVQDLAQKLASVSQAVSQMVYQLATKKKMPKVESDETIIAELLECYVSNSSCRTFQQIAGKPSNPSLPPYPLYVSVSVSSHKPNAITIFTHHIIGNYTGEVVPNRTEDNCSPKDSRDQIYSHFWISGDGNETGICIQSTAILTEALSPAFLIPDLTSTEYSTWTESVWSETSGRIFLQPSLAHNLIALFLGFLVLALSFGLVYLVEKRAAALFVCRQVSAC